MDDTDFIRASFNPSLRPALLAALQADPILANFARKRVAHLKEQHDRGQMFDRDHVSRSTYEMLIRMLAQVDAAKQQPSDVSVV